MLVTVWQIWEISLNRPILRCRAVRDTLSVNGSPAATVMLGCSEDARIRTGKHACAVISAPLEVPLHAETLDMSTR